jgi:hypothetical protein
MLEARLAHLPPGEWTPATPLFAEAVALARQVTLFQAVLELARHSLALEQTGEFAFSLSKRVSPSTATETEVYLMSAATQGAVTQGVSCTARTCSHALGQRTNDVNNDIPA